MLAAKIQPPRRAADTLTRTRLLSALHRNVERKLQLVVAPAGFGKTTLLLDFAHETGQPVAWAALDAGDRDLAACIETLTEALRLHFPGFGARLLAGLRGAADVEARAVALARLFALEVAERLDGFVVLVLDDYHEVNESGPVTQFVDELLRLLPDNLRLILASRSLPSLTVSRLIVEQQLFGLGEADLRFTAEELLTLMRRRGVQIAPQQARELAEGAEGWVAGFLLSVPRLWEGLVGGLIAARGGEGPLYDYLAAEAFDRQPADVQRFLLATSIPERVDAALCEALLGAGNWRAMLDQVEFAGLFVQRLQQAPTDFRYHQLFRSFLQTRLRRMAPAEFRRLHGVAARQLAARAEWTAALQHYLAAGEPDEAAALVARIYPLLEQSGRWRALAEVVSALPEDAAAAQPLVSLAGARAAVFTGDLGRAERFALAAVDSGRGAGDPLAEAKGLAVLGNVRRLQGRTREALETLQQALALAPADPALVAAVRRDHGKVLGMQGDFAAAAADLEAALHYFDGAGDEQEAARAEFGLGMALQQTGRLAPAIARYESCLARWQRLGDPNMQAEVLNSLGWAYGNRGEYGRARETLQEGLRLAQEAGNDAIAGLTLHSLGEVLLQLGDLTGARTAFERGLETMQDLGSLWAVTALYDSLALTAAFQSDLARAEEHAHHALGLARRQESQYLEALCSLTLGAIESRLGRPRALTTLLGAADAFAQMGAPRETARAHLWLAQAQHQAGAHEAVERHLRRALQLAGELGSDAVFDLHARWDPAPLFAGASAGIEPERLQAVLVRAGHTAPAPPIGLAPGLPALAARAFGAGTLTIDGGRSVDFVWDKARELFFLLLHSGPKRADQLLALLWPDSPAEKGKASLHTAVYRVRQAAGHKDALKLSAGVYRVNTELVVFYDVREFERLLQEAAAASGDQAVALLRQAVALYGGAFLEQCEAEWCVEDRDQLEQRYLRALERLSDAHAAAGQLTECIAAAEQLLARDPLRESAYARIIRAYLRLNDRPGAVRCYERCATLLRAELDIAPGPELQALAARLRA
ncbi:MAG TPA: BTAD domain-containing putative transcriptional regulator [Dehalococcoidia bacterium]|nr:BTAD domain-containing putative transcriptional regulator [Dehalococcoidia bacterium]